MPAGFDQKVRVTLSLLWLVVLAAGCGSNVSPEGQRKLLSLRGKWTTDANHDTLIVLNDGSFRWGQPYSGRFTAVSSGQIVISMRENGKWIGGMPVRLLESNNTVRLTPPSGPHMEFHRVVQAEQEDAR